MSSTIFAIRQFTVSSYVARLLQFLLNLIYHPPSIHRPRCLASLFGGFCRCLTAMEWNRGFLGQTEAACGLLLWSSRECRAGWYSPAAAAACRTTRHHPHRHLPQLMLQGRDPIHFAYDINATAEVVGFFYDSSGVVHSFTTDSSGTVTAFDPPGTATQPDFGSTSGGINGSGTSVGAFDDQQLEDHGFLRSSGGTFTTIDPPGSVATIAGCINDAGTVAGGFRDVSGLHGYV